MNPNGYESSTLPPHWKATRLCEVARVKYGKAKPRDSGNIPAVGSGGIYGSTAVPLITFPTLVIGRKGTAGMVWLQEKPCWPSDTTFYLEWRPNSVVENRFVYHCLQARPLSGQHARTTMPSLQRQDLEDYALPLPPLPEQRAIARALQCVQGAIQARRREATLERERKAALMQRLFTHGTRGEPRKQTDIGEMPESWQAIRLEEFIADGPQNGIYKPQSLYGEGTPIIRINDFDNDGMFESRTFLRVRLSPNEVHTYAVREGDILINRVNSLSHLGKCAISSELGEPTVFESNMMRFHVNEVRLVPEYLSRYLMTEGVRRRIRNIAKLAVAQASINQGDLKSIVIPYPSLVEQWEIAGVLKSCDAKITALVSETAALEELFRAVLEELMTGRLSALPLVETDGG